MPASWTKPRKFDRNLIVIGAGAAGLVSSYIAAMAKAKVTLIEAHDMGGDCLNTGCVPSKALLKSARVAHSARDAARYGIGTGEISVDFPRVMQRIREVITAIEQGLRGVVADEAGSAGDQDFHLRRPSASSDWNTCRMLLN